MRVRARAPTLMIPSASKSVGGEVSREEEEEDIVGGGSVKVRCPIGQI